MEPNKYPCGTPSLMVNGSDVRTMSNALLMSMRLMLAKEAPFDVHKHDIGDERSFTRVLFLHIIPLCIMRTKYSVLCGENN